MRTFSLIRSLFSPSLKRFLSVFFLCVVFIFSKYSFAAHAIVFVFFSSAVAASLLDENSKLELQKNKQYLSQRQQIHRKLQNNIEAINGLLKQQLVLDEEFQSNDHIRSHHNRADQLLKEVQSEWSKATELTASFQPTKDKIFLTAESNQKKLALSQEKAAQAKSERLHQLELKKAQAIQAKEAIQKAKAEKSRQKELQIAEKAQQKADQLKHRQDVLSKAKEKAAQAKSERLHQLELKKAQAIQAKEAIQKAKVEKSQQKELQIAEKTQQKTEKLQQRQEMSAQARGSKIPKEQLLESKNKIREERLAKQKEHKKLVVEVEGIYQEALRLYKLRKYEEARGKFQVAEKILSGYKATSAHLSRIDRDIESQKNLFLEKEKKISLQKERMINFSGKESFFRSISRQEFKKISEQAEPVYQLAIKLYKKDDFENAKDKFREVKEIYDRYKDADRYLNRINEIQTKRIEEEQQKKRDDLERQYRSEKLDKQVQKRIQDLQTSLAKNEEDRRLSQQAQELYDEAVELYKIQDYRNAKTKFLQIQEMFASYKSTHEYLDGIDEKIEQQAKYLQQEKEDPALKRLESLDDISGHLSVPPVSQEISSISPEK